MQQPCAEAAIVVVVRQCITIAYVAASSFQPAPLEADIRSRQV